MHFKRYYFKNERARFRLVENTCKTSHKELVSRTHTEQGWWICPFFVYLFPHWNQGACSSDKPLSPYYKFQCTFQIMEVTIWQEWEGRDPFNGHCEGKKIYGTLIWLYGEEGRRQTRFEPGFWENGDAENGNRNLGELCLKESWVGIWSMSNQQSWCDLSESNCKFETLVGMSPFLLLRVQSSFCSELFVMMEIFICILHNTATEYLKCVWPTDKSALFNSD